jgi:hypothetical protein
MERAALGGPHLTLSIQTYLQIPAARHVPLTDQLSALAPVVAWVVGVRIYVSPPRPFVLTAVEVTTPGDVVLTDATYPVAVVESGGIPLELGVLQLARDC